MKPHIDRTNLKQITVKAGLPLTLDVKIIGEPPPVVTWSFKDAELVSDDAVRVDNIDYNTTLLIMRAKRINSGKYKIKAKNEVGEDEAEVEIVVVGELNSCTK